MSLKLELANVHVLEKIPGSMQARLVRVQPAMRLTADDGVLFLQRGVVFTDGGEPFDGPLPKWFLDEVKKCTDTSLQECGFSKKKLLESKVI